MTYERGRVTVGVTTQGARHLDELMATDWFESEMALYLLAISTALSRTLVVGQAPLVGVKTKFNVGSLDRDGRLRDLIRLLGPKGLQDPYEYAERLADLGMEYLKARLVDAELTLSEVLNPALTEKREQNIDPSSESTG